MSRRWRPDRVQDRGAAPRVVLKAHPLARMATHVFVGDCRANLIDGTAPTFSNTTRPLINTQRFGQAFDCYNGATNTSFYETAPRINYGNAWTWALVVQTTTSTLNRAVVTLSETASGFCERSIHLDGGNTRYTMTYRFGASDYRTISTANSSVIYDKPQIVIASRSASQSNMWIDGVRSTPVNETGGVGYTAFNGPVVQIGKGFWNSNTAVTNSAIILAMFVDGIAWLDGQAQEFTHDPFQIFAGQRSATFYSFATGAAAQDIAPNLLSNSQTFYGPTITTGAVDIAPSLLTNSQTFHAPTVTPGAVDVAPSLLTNSQTFYDPTITAGAVDVVPDLLTNSQTFYDPTVSQATLQDIAPDLLTNAQTFFAPDVSFGGGARYVGGWEDWLLRREAAEAREIAAKVPATVDHAARRAAERAERERLSAKESAALLKAELATLAAHEAAVARSSAALDGVVANRAAAERARAEEYRNAKALMLSYRRLLAQVGDELNAFDAAAEAHRRKRTQAAMALILSAAVLH